MCVLILVMKRTLIAICGELEQAEKNAVFEDVSSTYTNALWASSLVLPILLQSTSSDFGGPLADPKILV